MRRRAERRATSSRISRERARARRSRAPARARCRARSPRPVRRAPAARATSAVSWQSSALRDPAADHVHAPRARGRSRARAARARAGTCRPARRGSSGRARRVRPARACPAAAHAARDPRRHVAAAQQRRVVGVEQRARRPAPRAASRCSCVVVEALPGGAHARRHSCSSHRPITLRSSRIVPSTPRSLVRLKAARVGRRASARSTSTPEQRPRARATGSPRPVRAAARRRTPTRCRARRPRCTGVPAAGSPWRSSTEPSVLPGIDDLAGERTLRQPEPGDQIARPAAARAPRAARSSRRSWPRWRARRSASRPNRSGTSAIRSRRRGGAAAVLGEQLEDRVDRHRLDAGPRDTARLARDARVRARDAPRRRRARRGSGTAARASGATSSSSA